MDFTNGMKKAFLASVGAAATTAEVTKDILEKMIEKGERTVEHGKVLNQELKHKLTWKFQRSFRRQHLYFVHLGLDIYFLIRSYL